ncbi:hypothetical protein J7M07_04390 [bacterium]|nr:hypothetical protein [bacterium]
MIDHTNELFAHEASRCIDAFHDGNTYMEIVSKASEIVEQAAEEPAKGKGKKQEETETPPDGLPF